MLQQRPEGISVPFREIVPDVAFGRNSKGLEAVRIRIISIQINPDDQSCDTLVIIHHQLTHADTMTPHSSVSLSRPGYIVLFKEKGEQNASLLSKVLGVGQIKQVGERSRGKVVLGTKDCEGRFATVFTGLAAASADLTDAQKKELQRSDQVNGIVQNQLRRLSPVKPSLAHPIQVSESAQHRDLSAYLKGIQAGVNFTTTAALNFIGGSDQSHTAWPAVGPSVRSNETLSWALQAIGISESYKRLTGKGIKVAVLDTGLDLTHPDFVDRPSSVQHKSFLHSHQSAQDGNGHGTHCSGVIAGPASSVGGRRYSVAPDASLLVGKVLNDLGVGWDDEILDGIAWASEFGARVISLSFGSSRSLNEPPDELYQSIAQTLVADNPGVLFVAAAGNSSDRPHSVAPIDNPAACPDMLAVAAIDRKRQVAEFSCGQVDGIGDLMLCAPGVDVYSSSRNGTFESKDGTSMATPFVAGAAALYLEQEPTLTAANLRLRLISTSKACGRKEDFGKGLVAAPPLT